MPIRRRRGALSIYVEEEQLLPGRFSKSVELDAVYSFAGVVVSRQRRRCLSDCSCDVYTLSASKQDPALSTGIRHLIYNAVGLDHTYRSSLTLTIPLIRWLLSETDWMDEEAAKLCAYLVRLEQVICYRYSQFGR